MAIFETSDQLYYYINELFEEIATLPETQEVIQSLAMCVRFHYNEPECMMTLTVANGEYTLVQETCDDDVIPDVELTMTGDIAYKFWTGELNVMGAITTHQIGINGSIGKIIRLTPLIKAAIQFNKNRT